MQIRIFGPQKRRVVTIGQGTWNFPERGPAVEEAKEALKKGLALGATHIDTAEMYGSGRAEEIVGEAIKGLPRNELFIVSKVLPANASSKGTIKACENSLKRLGTDYLDCYLLHWRGSHPLSATMEALEQLVKEGKIRSLGVSNFDVNDMKEAISYLSREKLACNQVLYNLQERGIERRLVPFCAEHEIAVVGYTPFGNVPAHGKSAGILASIAKKHAATVHQVVLAFLTRHPSTFAIPKAARLNHVSENSAASNLSLTAQEIEQIDDAFPAPAGDIPLATG